MNFQKLFYQNCNGNFYRKINAVINVILVLHQLFILCSEAYYLDNNPYRHKQILGPKASFVVEWSVNWKERAILFQVSAETRGWVGFGLSRDGRMLYSDAVIGGVDSFTGKPYFNDVHVLGNRSVQVDQSQDWKLIGAWEKGKRTYLSFSRAMETCDNQDYPITKDLVVLIWAYGETDQVEYHKKTRGSTPVYLLDPSISEELAHDHYRQIGPHSNLYLAQRWAVTNKLRLTARPTSVWCSIERGPRLLLRHDIVGMGALLPTKLARQHVQQMFLYKCTVPQQTEAATFFDPYVKFQGEECYLNEKRTLPLAFCRELIYVWGRGGKPFYFPEDIGIPIGESENEYYLLETHFDNPKGKADLDIEAGIEVVYSHRQKPANASLLQVGYGPFGTFMIPAGTTMNIYGSCGPKCTSQMFPKNGVSIFAVMLQSRSLGRQVALKHFRDGNKELPWILKDDNYDSEFQQMRLLTKQVVVLPGDQLTVECTFDSKGRNRTTFSGFSTHDEVCSAFVYVSNRLPFFRCTSELPADQLLSRYGVSNFTWDLKWQDRYITQPKRLEGTWIGDVVDNAPQLSKSDFEQLQRDLKYSPHLESCPNIRDMMGHGQNQLFRTFTNNWQLNDGPPILPTRTPHTTSKVAYPNVINEYYEKSSCTTSNSKNIHPASKIPPTKIRQPVPKFPSPLPPLNSFAAVPPAPPPPAPPLQHQEFFSLLEQFTRRSKQSSIGDYRINIPSSPPLPPINYNFLSQNVRPAPAPSLAHNRVPPPLKPPSPPTPTQSTRPPSNFKRRPKTKQRPHNSISIPIPPRHPGPPQHPVDFNSLTDKSRNQIPSLQTGITIPLVPVKQPNPSTDKSILNFFEQIANIFSSPKNKNKQNSEDGLSFQHIQMIDNNFLKKRQIGAK